MEYRNFPLNTLTALHFMIYNTLASDDLNIQPDERRRLFQRHLLITFELDRRDRERWDALQNTETSTVCARCNRLTDGDEALYGVLISK